jgi:hypothetical protein
MRPAMTEYAIIDDGVIVAFRDFEEEPVFAGKPYRKALPVEVADPPFDSATQVRTGPVVTIEATRVTRAWTVRDKTAEELAAEAEAAKARAVDGLALVEVRILFSHENRIRALEAKQPITMDQFKTALKAML